MIGRHIIRRWSLDSSFALGGWRIPSALAVLICCLLIGPTAAGAAEYTVNSTGDQADEAPGSNGCKTSVNTCTLRAAIEESNASAGINDTIKFSASFDGQVGDTIELGTPLPTITDRVRIQGFPSPQQCKTDYFDFEGPCVGVDGPAGGTAFRIAAERVVLIGFAISGAQTAIEAVGAPGLETWNDWFGIKLDGNAGPIETGISLDQGSNGANIGGASSVARDIFAHNAGAAVDIDGADAVSVRGSGFGVLPDGNSLAANGRNIEISDAATGENRVARGNWIGGTLNDEQLASSICDGACNVISGATESGIDLAGDDPDKQPASGSTRIFGNYIGLNAFGTTGIPNALQGVLIGSAENVTVGGPRPGDRNMINGGADGVLAGPNAGNLAVEDNWLGLDPAGTSTLAPPTTAGIATEGGYQTEIAGNRISMPSGTAIQQDAQEAVIRSNVIGEGVNGEDLPGGSIGIHLLGPCSTCNLVYNNSISHAGEYGVLVENERNDIYGNRIEASGAAGIRIWNPPIGLVGNLIGGNSAGEENTLSDNGGAAVEIALNGPFSINARNEVARNNGDLNGGPFIDLVDGGNGGILPPVITSAAQSGASGTGAEAGATIRVFRKTSSSPGELENFLAETSADSTGNWSVIYPNPIPSGTIVAATQTSLVNETAHPQQPGGTSELAIALTTAEPESGGGASGAGGGARDAAAGVPQSPYDDTRPPQTTVLSGPRKVSNVTRATFRFTSNEPGSQFQCQLDWRPVRGCRSPRTFRRLRLGNNEFKVWAIDIAGNKDKSPARYKFRVAPEN